MTNQKQDFEWLIHDGSAQSAPMFDPDQRSARPITMPVPGPLTIGAKRNALCKCRSKERSLRTSTTTTSYGPRYIEGMLSFMTDLNVDFVKLFGFFLYLCARKKSSHIGTSREISPQHYRLHPGRLPLSYAAPYRRRGRCSSGATAFPMYFIGGFGKKFAFPRTKDSQRHGEDQIFADVAVAKFRSAGKQDFARSCLHVIHSKNASFT